MADRARLSAPQPAPPEAAPHHDVTWSALPAELLMRADRRMEAANYLSGGYGIRLSIEAQRDGWVPLVELARVWQPSRLKGIKVSPEFGTPFLAATQVLELRPTPRKWLALERTEGASQRFVQRGAILVTCSGAVGKATLAYRPHLDTLITHDLLRIEPKADENYGWIYAYLKSEQAQEMMTGAQYGHVIKHLKCAHLNSLPVPLPPDNNYEHFNSAVRIILEKRDQAFDLTKEAEDLFANAVGGAVSPIDPEAGFNVTVTERVWLMTHKANTK
jgi:hypothetical protein